MSVLVELADAIVTSLNGDTFSVPLSAVRGYRPAVELKDLEALQVTVVPKALTISAATRSSSYFDGVIDVAVQQKVDADKLADLDALMGLVQGIADHLRNRRLEGLPAAVCTTVENDPVFAPEHLEQHRVFTSLLTVTYRVQR